MNLKQLGYFVAIGDSLSVTKASTRLRIAQPALTRHLKMLENHFGTPLTRRQGRGIVLTDAGAHLLERIRPLLKEINQVEEEVARFARKTPIEISLGLPSALSCFADRFIERAASLEPAVHLRIIDGWSGFVLDWLQSGQLDLGVIYDQASDANGLECLPLAKEEHYLIIPRAHPFACRDRISLADVAGLPLILPSRRHGLRQAIDRAFKSIGSTMEPAAEVDAVPTIRTLIERGSGYSILSDSEVRYQLPSSLVAVLITSPSLVRNVFIAFRPGAATANLAKVCFVIRDEALEMAKEGAWGGAARIPSSA